MKLKVGSYMAIFFALLGILGIFLILRFKYPETQRFPLAVAGLMTIVSIGVLLKEIITGEIVTETDEEDIVQSQDTKPAGKEFYLFATTLTWTGSFLVAIILLGFVTSSVLFAFSYTKAHGRGWLASLSFAVIITVVIYLGTEWGFDMPLPKGLLFP